MSKYYTPKIEEFHVGFEYEAMIANENYDGNGWMKLIYPKDPLIGEAISRKLNMEDLRVKYLDQEDIESLGFKYNTQGIFPGFIKGDKKLYFNTERVLIVRPDSERATAPQRIMFEGKIKNKSELKKVLQMIGVIKDE